MAEQSDQNDIVEVMFQHLYRPLRAYALQLIGEKSIAEDVVQDVFCEVWGRREMLRLNEEELKSYLFRSVYNRSLNALKNNQGNLTDSIDGDILEQYLMVSDSDSEQSLMLEDLQSAIFGIVDKLPPKCKEVFLLSRRAGLKNKEIAERLDISVKAVEKQITHALFVLQEYLEQNNCYK